MPINYPEEFGLRERIPSVIFWTAALLIAELWIVFAADSAAYAIPAIAAFAVLGFLWQHTRARSSGWKRVLDAYAEREIARAASLTYRESRLLISHDEGVV
jgi:hypothetical protein